MKHHDKLGAMSIACAIAIFAGAGCAMETDSAESEVSNGPAFEESVGDAQDAIWGYSAHAVHYNSSKAYAYRGAFTGGARLYW